MTMQIVPIEQIVVKEDRQRQAFPEKEMEELRSSIERKGLISPILVRPRNDGRFELVAGERRLRSVTSLTEPYMFGDTEVIPGEIPAVVKFFKTDMDAKEAELHENVVRLNLSWQERMNAIAQLHEYYKQKDPAHQVGQTAILVEEDDGKDRDYAKASTYKEVNSALFLARHLSDPDVANQRTVKDAMKVASRKEEEALMARLRATKLEAPKITPTVAGIESTFEPGDPLDDLPDLGAPSSSSNVKLTLLPGDMQEEIKKVPDGSISVVITDPPYGADVANFSDSGNAGLAHEYSEENYKELHQVLIQELDRVCAANAHVYIFCDFDFFVELKTYFSDEWKVRSAPITWDKVNMGKLADGTPQGYTRRSEFILMARRGNRPCSKVRGDVIAIPAVRDRVHAAQKPVDLYKELLLMSAIPGDNILDAFAGSGTVFQAAKEMMVNAYGIEMNEKYIGYCEQVIDGGGYADEEIPF